MLQFPATDDRDRPLRIPLSRVLWVMTAWAARLDISRRGIAREVVRMLRLPAFWLAVFGTGLLITIGLLTLQDTAMGLGLLIISPVAMPLLALALLTGRGLVGLGGDLPRVVRRDMLAACRCPVCEYDLAAHVAEPDTCVTCPECGAAWNWDAIGDRGGREAQVVVIPDDRPRRGA